MEWLANRKEEFEACECDEGVVGMQREMREAKAELADRKKEIEGLKVELIGAQQQVGELTGKLIQMQMQAQDAEERVAKEV